MRWWWWAAILVWIVGPMILIPLWYLMRRLLPLSDEETRYSDEGELRALRRWRAAGSPRQMLLYDAGPPLYDHPKPLDQPKA